MTPDAVHNVVVCTLCSCYPWPVLGLPDQLVQVGTYAYRSRMVIEPPGRSDQEIRTLEIDESIEVRRSGDDSTLRLRSATWSSPKDHEGTENMSEEELSGLVTRDAMVGVAPGPTPGSRGIQLRGNVSVDGLDQ